MSIALDTIIIFIFILVPGMVFRRFYYQGEFTKQYNSRTIGHGIIASILPGLFIQYLTLNIYSKRWTNINEESIKEFYQDISGNILPSNLFDLDILWQVLGYISLTLIVAWGLSMLCWGFVRIARVDRWLTILRFRNHWNYYFNGEIKGFRSYKGVIKGKILEIRADILVRVENEEPRLYSGVLRDYTINNDHVLEYVYLTKAKFYKKDNSIGAQSRILKSIPGDVFIVSAQDIININLHYITAETKKRNASSLVNFITFIVILIVIFSDYNYFKSDTIFKTMLLKVFFVIFSLFVGALLRVVFQRPYGEEEKSTTSGLIFIVILLSFSYWLLRYKIF